MFTVIQFKQNRKQFKKPQKGMAEGSFVEGKWLFRNSWLGSGGWDKPHVLESYTEPPLQFIF